jgi:hypothetical protein
VLSLWSEAFVPHANDNSAFVDTFHSAMLREHQANWSSHPRSQIVEHLRGSHSFTQRVENRGRRGAAATGQLVEKSS